MRVCAASAATSASQIRPDISHLLTPIYCGAVTALVLNDHVLKHVFPGLITGKLSDFAGLFAFAVFLSVVIRRHIPAIHAMIAVVFVAWKSPLSDLAIHAWNAVMPFRIARVVDYWDLLALSVLPLSMAYLRRRWWAIAPRGARTATVAVISLVAFTATSQIPWQVELTTGKNYARDGQYEQAIKHYDEALKEQPNFPEALYQRGIAKLKLGDTVGGEADIVAAGSIDLKYKPPAASDTERSH